MITIQVSGDRVRLYNDGDERMDALLAGIPCAGYSARFDADAYDLTAAQAIEFLAARLGVATPAQPQAPAPAHRSKQPISEAQRQARRENARKAAQARRKNHTV